MKVDRFEDWEMWQEARDLCKLIYRIASDSPFCYNFKFGDWIRSFPGSSINNIAEGFDRGGNTEFSQFLSESKGWTGEVKSQSANLLISDLFMKIDSKKFLNVQIA